MKKSITVFIADDHPIFRKGLRDVLREDPSIQLVGEAADGATALQQIRELKPQAAVLDLDMPQMNGMEIAKKISQLTLPVSLVILTMYKEERIFNEAINAGVLGYVLKENAASELLNCIHTVVGGQPFISPSLSAVLLNRGARRQTFRDEQPGLDALTPAETRILKLVAEDLTSKEIAGQLNISFHTVENHRAKISEKLNLRGSHSLLKFAFENKEWL